MSHPAEPYADPLVEEVRQRRHDLLARYGNDLEQLFKAIQQLQSEHPEKLVDPRRSRSHARQSSDSA